MSTVALVLDGLVALIHVYIVLLEMLWWDTPAAVLLGTSRELASQTKVLAANQGLYNGFLVAGLLLAMVGPSEHRFAFAVFSLGCGIVAGLYGAAMASRKILFVQTVPAALALAAQFLAR